MKALSIQQPWAWLIVHGHKDIENRTWSTKFRGRVLVHAGKRIDKEGLAYLQANDTLLPDEFELGGIVGETTIVDCVDDHDSDWFEGPFGFVLTDSKPLPFRPYKGALGFFDAGDNDA